MRCLHLITCAISFKVFPITNPTRLAAYICADRYFSFFGRRLAIIEEDSLVGVVLIHDLARNVNDILAFAATIRHLKVLNS